MHSIQSLVIVLHLLQKGFWQSSKLKTIINIRKNFFLEKNKKNNIL
jgi:hypothetical protein